MGLNAGLVIANEDPFQKYTTEYIAKEIGQSNPIDFNSEEEAPSSFAKTFHLRQNKLQAKSSQTAKTFWNKSARHSLLQFHA